MKTLKNEATEGNSLRLRQRTRSSWPTPTFISVIAVMNRTVLAISLFIILGSLPARPGFAADPLMVDLWPGKVPGDIGISGQETSRIHQSPLVGPTKLITNVTRPTLSIYQPAKDKNTRTAMVICPGGGDWDLYWELE